MNWIIVGGAPLSRETHEFIRVCLGAIVVQVITKSKVFKLFQGIKFYTFGYPNRIAIKELSFLT